MEAPIDLDETVDVEVPPDAVVEPAEAEVIEMTSAAPADAVEIEVEAPPVADAEVIAETDEDDEPQPNVLPDGRPIGGGGAKTKRPARGGRKTGSGSARQSRGSSSKPRARKRS